MMRLILLSQYLMDRYKKLNLIRGVVDNFFTTNFIPKILRFDKYVSIYAVYMQKRM
jgi:hypothetical protein